LQFVFNFIFFRQTFPVAWKIHAVIFPVLSQQSIWWPIVGLLLFSMFSLRYLNLSFMGIFSITKLNFSQSSFYQN
jgi:hypothetical protein